MDARTTLSESSYANAVEQSTDGLVRPVDAWIVTSDGFNGIVYTHTIALHKLATEQNCIIGHVTLYRPVTRKNSE